MRLGGLQKTTLLDFPGCVACTVFTVGCNLRCAFCHNASLVLPNSYAEQLSESEFFMFLEERQGILDGVAVSGGEPLLQPDIEDFLYKIKSLGFSVKLDTNGTFSDKLILITEKKLVDYVAMDIKNSPAKYELTAGKDVLSEVRRSADHLMRGETDFEFRTTTVAELHSPDDLKAIGEWLAGNEKYFIQSYEDSGDILDAKGLSAPSPELLNAYLDAVRPYIPDAELRGK